MKLLYKIRFALLQQYKAMLDETTTTHQGEFRKPIRAPGNGAYYVFSDMFLIIFKTSWASFRSSFLTMILISPILPILTG